MPQCPQCLQMVAVDAERCPQCGAWLADASKTETGDLQSAVLDLMKQGEKIQAIKLYREGTGTGLAEAKAAVEHIERAGSASGNALASDDWRKQILELVAAGQKISAIKLYREQTNTGLKEAKDAVEELAARHGIATPARAGCAGVLALVLMGVTLLVIGCSKTSPPADIHHTADAIKESAKNGLEFAENATETATDPQKRREAFERAKQDLKNPPRQFK